jgi:hypothetical protein
MANVATKSTSNMKATVKENGAKEKEKVSKLTDAILFDMGLKGQIMIVLRNGYKLAAENKFKGTKSADKEATSVNGSWYAKMNRKGSFLKLEETSETFKKLRVLAREAKDDIFASKYSKEVSTLIDEAMKLPGSRGESVNRLEILKDIKL